MSDAARVSFTITRYSPARALLGALHMATQRPLLARTPGARFWRLMGAGFGLGFSARPDPLRWALLCAWRSEDHWERFRSESRVMRQYRERGEEVYSLLLEPAGGHGRWGGSEPWSLAGRPLEPGEPVVVLTRATIRLARQLRFWSRVDPVKQTLQGNPDLLLSFGVGESPYVRQATLSAWRSVEGMKRWAYGADEHRDVVRRTRAEGWYAEELFARFRPLRSYGTVGGADPLRALALPGAA